MVVQIDPQSLSRPTNVSTLRYVYYIVNYYFYYFFVWQTNRGLELVTRVKLQGKSGHERISVARQQTGGADRNALLPTLRQPLHSAACRGKS